MDYRLGINESYRPGLKHIVFEQFHLLTVEKVIAHSKAYGL